MYAGIDSGTTLKKAVLRKSDDFLQLVSGVSDKSLCKVLQDTGIRVVAEIGMRSPSVSLPEGVQRTHPVSEDRITTEITCQAVGANAFLGHAKPGLENFLLVSIGTGVSYTAVRKGVIDRYPIGSALGGGFIKGVASMCGISVRHVADMAQTCGASADILIKDLDATKKYELGGDIVVSHFGRATKNTGVSALIASAINTVAAGVAKDIMVMGNFLAGLDGVVYIGTPVAKIPALRKRIVHYHRFIPLDPVILLHGEFSAALGALLCAEREAVV